MSSERTFTRVSGQSDEIEVGFRAFLPIDPIQLNEEVLRTAVTVLDEREQRV